MNSGRPEQPVQSSESEAGAQGGRSSELRRCKTHGLSFNPDVYSGCVVCRRQTGEQPDLSSLSRPPAARRALLPKKALGAAGGALVLLLGAAALSQLGGDAELQIDGLTRRETSGAYGECRTECGQAALACDHNCQARQGNASCQQGCLDGVRDCDVACGTKSRRPMDPASYSHGVGKLPPWFDVLEQNLDLNEALLSCGQAPFMAQVSIDEHGVVGPVVVYGAAPDEPAELCQAQLLREASFPATGGPYTFVAQLDPRLSGSKLLVRRAERDLQALKDAGEVEASRLATAALWELKQKLVRRDADALAAAQEAARRAAEQVKAAHVGAGIAPSSPPVDAARPASYREPRAPTYVTSGADADEDPSSLSPGALIDRGRRRSNHSSHSMTSDEWELQRLRDKREQSEAHDAYRKEMNVRKAEQDCWAHRRQMIHAGRRPDSIPPCSTSYW